MTNKIKCNNKELYKIEKCLTEITCPYCKEYGYVSLVPRKSHKDKNAPSDFYLKCLNCNGNFIIELDDGTTKNFKLYDK